MGEGEVWCPVVSAWFAWHGRIWVSSGVHAWLAHLPVGTSCEGIFYVLLGYFYA